MRMKQCIIEYYADKKKDADKKKNKETLRYLEKEMIIRAVVGVPAAFQNEERKATERAIKIAGMEMIRMTNEPTAAAYAYGEKLPEGHSLVFDFGGGTLDITIIEKKVENGEEKLNVVRSVGDPFLGGNDIDNNIIKFIEDEMDKICDLNGIDQNDLAKKKERFSSRIKKEAERMKIAISERYYQGEDESGANCSCDLSLEFLGFDDLEDPIILTYEQFDAMNKDIFNKCKTLINKALSESCLTKSKIKKVLLSGGSSKCPEIKILLNEMFGNAVDTSNTEFELLVCKGCSRVANDETTGVTGQSVQDVCSQPITIPLKDDVLKVFDIGDKIPSKKSYC